MHDEKMKILEMIAAGKVTPAEGADLLQALEQEKTPRGGARRLLIRVTEPDTGAEHVNVKIPMGFAGKMLKFVNRFVPQEEIDLQELHQAVRSGEPGQVMQVDTDDGQRVEIWLED